MVFCCNLNERSKLERADHYVVSEDSLGVARSKVHASGGKPRCVGCIVAVQAYNQLRDLILICRKVEQRVNFVRSQATSSRQNPRRSTRDAT